MAYKLVTPPDNWQGAVDIPDATLPVLERLARQYGGTYKVEDRKVYFHPTEPQKAPRFDRPKQGDLKLEVPYYSQLDSQIYGGAQALRMCQSSSCAMLLKALRPGALSDRLNADDDYLARVLQYGDTTDGAAQLQALRHFGVDVDFRTNLGWKDVDAQLAAGIPVPIGILHHGHVSQPNGGGHWMVVVGRRADGSAYFVHDPAGELDLVAGQYLGTDGKYQLYSRENLGRRWMADALGHYSPGSGWGFVARR